MFEKNKLFDQSVVNHSEVIQKLVVESSPRKVFLMMIIISSVIASLGLLNDSSTVVIGAMLVAPLLWPVLGVSMGLLVRNWRMIRLSLISIAFSLGLGVVTAMFITFFYIPLGASSQILQGTNFGFMLPVAIAAGAAVSFAISYDSVREAVPGVAISVALLPPLVSVGIGLGGSDWDLMNRALELLLINFVGIVMISYLIFLSLGFHNYEKEVNNATKKEEKVLKST